VGLVGRGINITLDVVHRYVLVICNILKLLQLLEPLANLIRVIRLLDRLTTVLVNGLQAQQDAVIQSTFIQLSLRRRGFSI